MPSQFTLTRRSLIKGAAASSLILPASGLCTPAIAQSKSDRVISPEPGTGHLIRCSIRRRHGDDSES